MPTGHPRHSHYLKLDRHKVPVTSNLDIFIDDLDRCLPDVALEVLEALKLYLNIPQFEGFPP